MYQKMADWLARVNHDLVKRMLWPARDFRDLGQGQPRPGDLVAHLVDDEGRPIAAEALWQALREQGPADSPALDDLVVLDLHFALPEERLLPEDKTDLPADPAARKTVLEGLRRRQGLLILERLRRDYPKLPVVMLTTTSSELGSDRPADPLVY